MTVTLELTPELEAALREEAEQQGVGPEGLSEQAAMQALAAGLRDRRIPQPLDEIKPHRLPPPGKTVWEMIVRLSQRRGTNASACPHSFPVILAQQYPGTD